MTALTPYDALKQSQAMFCGDVAAQLRAYGYRLAVDVAADRPDLRVMHEEAIYSAGTAGPLLSLRLIGEGGPPQAMPRRSQVLSYRGRWRNNLLPITDKS